VDNFVLVYFAFFAFLVVFSFCLHCLYFSVLYFTVWTNVNGTVGLYSNCADLPLRIYSLTLIEFTVLRPVTDGRTDRIGLAYIAAQNECFGVWSADRCFPLPYVANATPSTTDANYWTVSTLSCYRGHRFFIGGSELDSMIMTCQNNGWWSPILTACKRERHYAQFTRERSWQWGLFHTCHHQQSNR